jgi:hypothetical protein
MVHVRSDGRFAAANNLGDFRVGQSVPVSQHDNRTLLRWQGGDCGRNQASPLGRDGQLDGRRRVGGWQLCLDIL